MKVGMQGMKMRIWEKGMKIKGIRMVIWGTQGIRMRTGEMG